MDTILQVENLTKQYEGFQLDHVSFDLPKGTIIGLIGENGAGKSTTINAILDLIKKDDGTVTFWGQELSSSKQLKEDIGVVFDGVNFYETLTPAKVGKISGSAYKQWDEYLYRDYLKRFGLPLDKEIKTLSKGMKMNLNWKLFSLARLADHCAPVRACSLSVSLSVSVSVSVCLFLSSHRAECMYYTRLFT